MEALCIQNKKIFYVGPEARVDYPVISFFVDIPDEHLPNYFAELIIGGSTFARTSIFTKVEFDKTTCELPEECTDKKFLYRADFFENAVVIRGDLCTYHVISVRSGINPENLPNNIFYCQLANGSEINASFKATRNDILKCQYVSFNGAVTAKLRETYDENSEEIDMLKYKYISCDDTETSNAYHMINYYKRPEKNDEINATEPIDYLHHYNLIETDHSTYYQQLVTYQDPNYNPVIDGDYLQTRGYHNCHNVIRYMSDMAGLAFSN